MPMVTPWLATSTQSESLLLDIAPYLLVLAGIVVVGIVLTGVIRRRLLQSHRRESLMDFTLDDLRRLHADGQLSDEEFSQASSRMIEAMTAAGEHHKNDTCDTK